MKTFIVFPHVAGMCESACVNLDLISGFAPHRDLPGELTVVYSEGNHFWVSVPFKQFISFLHNEVNSGIKLSSLRETLIIDAPTKPLSDAAKAVGVKKTPVYGGEWVPGAREYRPRPAR